MTPVERDLEKLPGAKRSGQGWSAVCPAHDDTRASLTIGEGDDGRALVKCQALCTFEAVVSALGLTARDLMPDRDSPPPSRNGKANPATKTFPTADAAVAELKHGMASGRRCGRITTRPGTRLDW